VRPNAALAHPSYVTAMLVLPTLDDLRSGAVLFHDAARSCVAVTGEDRFAWLNGATTCDVNALATKKGARAAYGCVLTVKGKLLGDVYVAVSEADALVAWVPASSRGQILQQWEKFIVMEDVELSVDDTRGLLLLQGGGAEAIAASAGLAGRGAKLDELGLGGGLVLDVAEGERASVVAALEAAGARLIDEAALRALRVEAGRATYGVDVDGASYVQEGGLEKRAVSFTKGCYVGQEVVVMLQMRGRVHRKLARLAFAAGAEALVAGVDVELDGGPIGKLTSVAHREGGRASALAMVKYAALGVGKRVTVAGVEGEIVGEAG
jgi:hypothetical protein